MVVSIQGTGTTVYLKTVTFMETGKMVYGKMVILEGGFCTSTQSHYGYEFLPTTELEKKPPAALENDSIQPKCLQQSPVHRVLQEFLQA